MARGDAVEQAPARLNGQVGEEVTLQDLHASVTQLTQQVKAMAAWDDRLGSALKRAWHWRLFAVALLLVVGYQTWERTYLKPDILPYLYVVDPLGELLYSKVPGRYTVDDTLIGNMLEDWVKQLRERDVVGPEAVPVMRKAWDKAERLTAPKSEAMGKIWDYMREHDPRKTPVRHRVELQVTHKRVVSTWETGGQYKLIWTETKVGTNGRVEGTETWEAEFWVELKVPKTLLEAQKQMRYGMFITRFSWGPGAPLSGG